MSHLVMPASDYSDTVLAGIAEFVAEGRGATADDSALGSEIRLFGEELPTPEGFAAYVDYLVSDGLPETPRAAHRVPQSTFWLVDGPDYLGSIRIRHRLNELLLEVGGHIGYDVRPSVRLRGHGTEMLRLALPVAASLGIERALVTTDPDNLGSRRVIANNGGVFEDERQGKLRFWVPTS